MYDRAILLMYKAKAKHTGFLALVCLTLDPYQLETVHWPKEIRQFIKTQILE